jgi:hypothetical protein
MYNCKVVNNSNFFIYWKKDVSNWKRSFICLSLRDKLD